jgi:hypothetical protein
MIVEPFLLMTLIEVLFSFEFLNSTSPFSPTPRGLCHVGLSLVPSPSPLTPSYPCLEGAYVCVLNS